MTYKTILVSLNEVGRTAESVAAAAALARELGAHVSGLYVIPAVQVYPSVGFEPRRRCSRATAPSSRTMRRA